MDYQIQSLFADPLYSSSFDITENQTKFIKNLKYDKNELNDLSQNKQILDSPELTSLKTFIEHHLNSYFKNVLGAGDELKPFISQSWVNKAGRGEAHPPHTHSNCNVSGVYYVEVNENDGLMFARRNNLYYKIYPKNINQYNAFNVLVPIKKGLLYLFPSDVFHSVPKNEDNNIRYSLAFNGFAKGKWGSYENLTYLEV
jgi:uncharacterized protein (TIGR02466 family)